MRHLLTVDDDGRHLALLGAFVVAALQLRLLYNGPIAAHALLCVMASAGLGFATPRNPCLRASVALAQLVLCLMAVHALGPLVEARVLAGRALTLLAALLLLERGATFTQRLRLLGRVARRLR